jgi:hypothetical protein
MGIVNRTRASRPREGGSIPSTVKDCYLGISSLMRSQRITGTTRHRWRNKGLILRHFLRGRGETDTCKLEIYTNLSFIPYHVTGSHLNTSCRNVSQLFRELRYHYDTKDGFCKYLGILCYSAGIFYARDGFLKTSHNLRLIFPHWYK